MTVDVLNKKALREVFLNKRKRLTSAEIFAKSDEIAQKILELPEIKSSHCLSLYLSINNEAETEKIINRLIDWEKTIVVPCYLTRANQWCFAQFVGWENLQKGPQKILQPKNTKPIDPSAIKVAILPGIAFSKNGVRLGYGKGVFDRLLSDSFALKIGLAYDFQIVDKLPKEKHDLVMDLVVTERRVLRFFSI